MNNNFFDNFIRWTSDPNNKAYKWLSIILAPVFFLIYKRECKIFWAIIINEIGDKDEIVKFLDRNEFGLTNHKLYKKDVVVDSDDLFIQPMDNLKKLIFRDYSETLLGLFAKHCQLDIENYISLLVDCSLSRDNENNLIKLYEVSIVYYRYNLYAKSITTLKWWLVVVGIICSALYLAPIYI